MPSVFSFIYMKSISKVNKLHHPSVILDVLKDSYRSGGFNRNATSADLQFRPPVNTRVGTLIVATIYLQLIQNRYMFRSFTVLHCSHQHFVQPVATDVEVVGYL